eukprot:726496-Pyramimonas_sp.AAC.2
MLGGCPLRRSHEASGANIVMGGSSLGKPPAPRGRQCAMPTNIAMTHGRGDSDAQFMCSAKLHWVSRWLGGRRNKRR